MRSPVGDNEQKYFLWDYGSGLYGIRSIVYDRSYNSKLQSRERRQLVPTIKRGRVDCPLVRVLPPRSTKLIRIDRKDDSFSAAEPPNRF